MMVSNLIAAFMIETGFLLLNTIRLLITKLSEGRHGKEIILVGLQRRDGHLVAPSEPALASTSGARDLGHGCGRRLHALHDALELLVRERHAVLVRLDDSVWGCRYYTCNQKVDF